MDTQHKLFFLFIRPSHSVTQWCCWLYWCHPGMWRLLCCCWVFHGEVVFVVDARTKQKPCCWCWLKNMVLMPEQKNMLLKPEQNKSHFVDARFVTWICWNRNINLSNLMLVFVDVVDMKSNQAEVWPRIQSFFEASALN